MTIHDQHEPSRDRDIPREPPQSGAGLALPVAALAALTAAVIWFGLSPAPPSKPKAAGPAGPAPCASCGSQPAVAAATSTPTPA